MAKTKNWRKVNKLVGEIWESLRRLRCTCHLLRGVQQ